GTGPGRLALQQRSCRTGCGTSWLRPVPIARLLCAGTSAQRRIARPAQPPPATAYGGLGPVSAAAAPVTQGQEAGGASEKRTGAAAGVSAPATSDGPDHKIAQAMACA